MEDGVEVVCPYCGESIPVYVDATAGDQDYVEDCWVCCRPIEMRVTFRGGAAEVTASASG